MSDWKKTAEAAAASHGITTALAATIKQAVLADKSVNREEVVYLLALRAKATRAPPRR